MAIKGERLNIMPKVDEGGVAEQAASSQEAEEAESFIGEAVS